MALNGELGAIELTLIAFSVVFLVLALLTLVIFAMKTFSSKEGTPQAAKAASAAAPATVPVPAVNKVAAQEPGATDDEELVAVITAALACELGEDVSVRSVVPAGTQGGTAPAFSGWISAGRSEGLQGWPIRDWN
ncbi:MULTISPECIES: OadG family protein [Jonquetella]|uniref:Sodium pump decarboxylase gamma subunit family protein n=1 Tax=Jonquetella anthropi DSM 22815 TaxID=885272 RepID=H0UK64_9BACT|nr:MULTISPECIES: OadG family protein [Jonquetella]EEX48454.1 sodium pump decarboxylase, gamma subunit [Jonquetella anthropi E3_33 E1]EHM13073.1 sodium pump decarboxylase gamma subunit family protein [Jonquetella anthropi DSM 22815]ERL23883.1 sodium pump decarboxylase, gamma subunit [Jonquetella sp. BV3C21]